MKPLLPFLIGCLCIPFLSFSQQKYDHLIFPIPEKPVEIVLAEQSTDDMITGRIAQAYTGLLTYVLDELTDPFHLQMIRVSQCARYLSGNTEGPNLLLLSKNEGGFPRQGIKIVSDDSETTYPDLHFVDLVIDEKRLENGALSIYSHELGHVMMNLILNTYWDRFPSPTSPKQHVSMGVTDYLTAFYEGWGVSFQRLAYDAVEKYRSSFHAKMSPKRGLTMAWHSNLDKYLRLFKVEDNGYLYQKSPIRASIWDTLSPEQKILYEHTSTQFDISRIRNAQQLLSSEGFLATLFYQINSNPELQNKYADDQFYSGFLLKPIPDGVKPQDIFTPLENVLLKNLAVWHKMNQSEGMVPVSISYIKTWMELFPDNANEVISTFILLSRGATVNIELPRLVEKVNLNGQMGDIGLFREYSGLYFSEIQKIIKQVAEDPNLLTAAIGPELWVSHPTMEIRRALWMPEPKAPLQINLNSAGFADVAAFIGEEEAMEFIAHRRFKGFFESMDEIKSMGFKFE